MSRPGADRHARRFDKEHWERRANQVRERVPILSVKLAADVPAAQREKLEVLRTDSASFAAIVEAKRNRHDAFYAVPAGKVGICNIDVPVRSTPAANAGHG